MLQEIETKRLTKLGYEQIEAYDGIWAGKEARYPLSAIWRQDPTITGQVVALFMLSGDDQSRPDIVVLVRPSPRSDNLLTWPANEVAIEDWS